jgi:hypothetical protein
MKMNLFLVAITVVLIGSPLQGGHLISDPVGTHVEKVRDKLRKKSVAVTKKKNCRNVPKRFRNAEHPYADGPNGCGGHQTGKAVRDSWVVVDFTRGCDRHDRCYSTLGKSFKECNRDFRSDLRKICKGKFRLDPFGRLACYGLADAYFVGVSTRIAKDAYEEAQDLQKDYEEWYATCDEE